MDERDHNKKQVDTGSGVRRYIWIMKLAGRSKEHIARSDEFGEPHNTTLCGLPCSAEHRTYSKKTASLSGRECLTCLARLTPRKQSRPSGLIWHRSDKKLHWLVDDLRIACGQGYSTWAAEWIEMVTCDRCLAIAAKAEVRKMRKSHQATAP